MGTYTELVLKTHIRTEDPLVRKILTFMFDANSLSDHETPTELPDHPFFKSTRWQAVGNSHSFYHIPCTLNYFKDNYLFSRSDFKNYDNQIDLFLHWLSPYIPYEIGAVIGWVCLEQREPFLIRKGGKVYDIPEENWTSNFSVETEENYVEVQGYLTVEELENVIQYYKMKDFKYVYPGNENSALVLINRTKKNPHPTDPDYIDHKWNKKLSYLI